MRVVCRHGHFAFYPKDQTEVLRLKTVYDLELEAENDYFTFPGLIGLPRWSQAGLVYAAPIVASVTYEAQNPWEVMRANDVVYSLALGTLVLSASITEQVRLSQTDACAVVRKILIQPGSILPTGVPLLGYVGEMDLRLQRLYLYSQETPL